MSDGGPVFPLEWARYEGMTLRDYFAAKAVAAMLGSKTFTTVCSADYRAVARISYEVADVMLEARKR